VGHPRAYADRLDPGEEVRRQAGGLRLLASPPASWLLRALGTKPNDLRRAKEIATEIRELLGDVDRLAPALAERGWILFGLAPLDEYRRAAQLILADRPDEADELLVDAWNTDDATRLRWAPTRLQRLYAGHPDREGIGLARGRLAFEALECQREGRYAAALPLVLAQIDGVVLDLTAGRPKMFFTRKGLPGHLVDEVTLAGHPAGLQALSRLMTPSVTHTTITPTRDLRRHGVMHGRDLAYDTKLASTQAFVALLATLEWGMPLAREQADRARREHVERHAGSRERDEDGRLLDRRGFDHAQRVLGYARGQQHRHFADHGEYAQSQPELDPSGLVFEGADVPMRRSADGRTFWAWTATETGYVFAVAVRDGEWSGWEFADWTPPHGGPDADDRWRSLLTDEPHPEWTG